VLNLAFAPEPWLRWQAEVLGLAMPKSVSEALGLYRERLHPSETPDGVDGWWEVSDDRSARAAVADMTDQLDRAGWHVLERMFPREALTTRLHDRDLGPMRPPTFDAFFVRAEALLLMDDGPSEELDRRLDSLLSNGMPEHREHDEQFDAWVRAQAAAC